MATFLPNIPRARYRLARDVEDEFVAWPMVDSLYNFLNVLGPDHYIASLLPGQQPPPVAIIGAGPSGIVAAFELMRAGFTPVIFEAGDRIGGRNWSVHLTGQAIAEMGAMRVPTQNKVFFHYADMVGLTYGPFPDPGVVLTSLYYENQRTLWLPGDKPPGQFEQISEDFNRFVGPYLAKIWNPWRKGDLDQVRTVWQEYINRWCGVSWYEGVAQGTGWNAQQLNAFGALGMGSGGFGPLYPISFLDIFRLLVNQLETDQLLIAEGIETLTERLYALKVPRAVGAPASLQELEAVHFGCRVTAVKPQPDGNVAIQYVEDGVPKSKIFGAAIAAITTRAMEKIGFTLPGSPVAEEDPRVSLRVLHMTQSSKLFIQTKTKFWLNSDGTPNPSIPQTILTDEMPRSVYCINYGDPTNPNEPGVVLVSYVWEDDSAKLLSMTPDQRFVLFRNIIAQFEPEFAEHLIPDAPVLSIDWQTQEYYQGAFKLNFPDQETWVQKVYYQFLTCLDPERDTGVYLAGDGVGWNGGWTECAMETGLNAAAAVAQRLGAVAAPDGPLTQQPLYEYPPVPVNAIVA
jgi:tryptophan 2-monooxygenase